MTRKQILKLDLEKQQSPIINGLIKEWAEILVQELTEVEKKWFLDHQHELVVQWFIDGQRFLESTKPKPGKDYVLK